VVLLRVPLGKEGRPHEDQTERRRHGDLQLELRTAMETIVWSMNVIATAKIMAASTQLRPCRPFSPMAVS